MDRARDLRQKPLDEYVRSGVRVRFTDDAKRRWELWDDRSLSEVENSTASSEEMGLDTRSAQPSIAVSSKELTPVVVLEFTK